MSHILQHCMDRYHIHHKDATPLDLLRALKYGTEIPADLAMTIVGRQDKRTTDRYVISPDLIGIFVIDKDVVVTYLRLGDAQILFVTKHWGVGDDTPPNISQGEENKARDAGLYDNHPDLGLPTLTIAISSKLAQRAGSKAEARRIIHRATKVDERFDPTSWTETVEFKDKETGLKILVIIERDSLGCRAHADEYPS